MFRQVKLVELMRDRLRGTRGGKGEARRAKIYLANGEVHEFELEDE